MNKWQIKIKKRLGELRDKRSLRFRLQRLVLNPDHREIVATWIAFRRKPILRLEAPTDPEAVRLMNEHGYYQLGTLLDKQKLEEIQAHLSQHPTHDPYRPEHGLFHPDRNPPRETHVAHYQPETLLTAPHLLDLANDSRILSIVRNQLGCDPLISYMAAWWSLAGQHAPEQAELFHRDVDDWRFIKLFVYLSEVDDECGPHIYVEGSHRKKDLLPIRRYEDEVVAQTFGSNKIIRFTGKAGTGFLENTFGMHRGLPPTKRNRLIFQVVYSLFPLPYGPAHPIAPWDQSLTEYDRTINSVYFY